MSLPAKPACMNRWGVIQCERKCDVRCLSSRYFWNAALHIAQMPTHRDRWDYIATVATTRGQPVANQLRDAAKQLMEAA